MEQKNSAGKQLKNYPPNKTQVKHILTYYQSCMQQCHFNFIYFKFKRLNLVHCYNIMNKKSRSLKKKKI